MSGTECRSRRQSAGNRVSASEPGVGVTWSGPAEVSAGPRSAGAGDSAEADRPAPGAVCMAVCPALYRRSAALADETDGLVG